MRYVRRILLILQLVWFGDGVTVGGADDEEVEFVEEHYVAEGV